MEYKYLIIVRDGIVEIEGESYEKILRKERSTSLKEIRRIFKRFKEEYLEKEIIVKERFRGKWSEIKVLNNFHDCDNIN
ncbi:hypothetical protein [Cetobacterium sp.]|uniref:hypothetical protein n=1 Tax=Cetobacterium sp. TaxID=2071632 RepID=UPI003F345F0D